MSMTGRGIAWGVIVVSTLFISAYLLNAEVPAGMTGEGDASPNLSVAAASEWDEGTVVGAEAAPEEAAARVTEDDGMGDELTSPAAATSIGEAAEVSSTEGAPAEGETDKPTVDPENAPQIEFEATTWNFGTMYQEEKVSHVFVYRNVGKGPLRIENIKADCGCTTAQPSHRELLPGQQGTISIVFSSGHFRDKVTKLVHVDTNDPTQPRLTLTVTGVVKVEVQVNPIGIYIGQIELGTKVVRAVEILPVEVSKFKLLGTRVTDPAIQVLRTEGLKKGGKRGYRLVVQYGPAARPGRVSANLLVKTDFEHSREIAIRVYGRVMPPEDENEAKPEG